MVRNLNKGAKMSGKTNTSKNQIIGKERDGLLYQLIEELPELQGRRFLLYYDYGFNYYQIGAMEHCSTSAARNSVAIAREKIKAQMRKYLAA